MTNKFYEPGEHRGSRVKELFARIAPRYDLINDLQSFGLHRYWKRTLVKLARPHPDEQALDLCCGTGDLSLLMARRGAGVLGLDFSERMLAVAQRRKTRIGRPRGLAWQSANGRFGPTRFILGDALRLPFPDRCFQIVTVAYGLRNLADLRAGLIEMQRVARPGARLLVLDFGKPDNPLWRAVYFAYLRLFVPVLGLVFCGSPSAYAYILESLRHYPAQRGVAAQMRELGLSNVQIFNFLGGVMSINYAEVP